MNTRVRETRALAILFQTFYGYIFCKFLGNNTSFVEIFYVFNGLVVLMISMTVSTCFHSVSFLFILLDEQKIDIGAFDKCIVLHY